MLLSNAELGEAWDIPKIYWGAMSKSQMAEGIRKLREAGDETSFEGWDPDNLPWGADDDEPRARPARAHRLPAGRPSRRNRSG